VLLLSYGMGTAIMQSVPDQVKPSFLTSGQSDGQDWTSEYPDVRCYKWWLNPVWHRMLYSCAKWQQWVSKG